MICLATVDYVNRAVPRTCAAARGTASPAVVIAAMAAGCSSSLCTTRYEICVNVFGFIISHHCMLMSTDTTQRMNMVRPLEYIGAQCV